jgi:hypothetical protein
VNPHASANVERRMRFFAVVALVAGAGCGPKICPEPKQLFEVQGTLEGSAGGVLIDQVVDEGDVVDVVLGFQDPVTIRFTKGDTAPVLPDDTTPLAVDGTAASGAQYVRISDGEGPVLEGGKTAIVDGKKNEGAPEIDGALVADKSQPTTSCERDNTAVSFVDATFATDSGDVRVAAGETARIVVDGIPMLAVGLGGAASSTVAGSGFHTVRLVNGYAYRVK